MLCVIRSICSYCIPLNWYHCAITKLVSVKSGLKRLSVDVSMWVHFSQHYGSKDTVGVIYYNKRIPQVSTNLNTILWRKWCQYGIFKLVSANFNTRLWRNGHQYSFCKWVKQRDIMELFSSNSRLILLDIQCWASRLKLHVRIFEKKYHVTCKYMYVNVAYDILFNWRRTSFEKKAIFVYRMLLNSFWERK